MNIETHLLKKLEALSTRMVKEEHDPQDNVTLDIPLLIRLLELAREDIKTDAELHHVVERTLAIKDRGTLSMDDYEEIAGTPTAVEPEATPSDDNLEKLRKLAGLK